LKPHELPLSILLPIETITPRRQLPVLLGPDGLLTMLFRSVIGPVLPLQRL
jgi:hypothetical protein